MVDGEVESWSIEESGNIFHVSSYAHSPSPLDGLFGSFLCSLKGHALTDEALSEGGKHGCIHRSADILGEEVVHVAVEKDGRIGMQPLLAAKQSCCPSPGTVVVVF